MNPGALPQACSEYCAFGAKHMLARTPLPARETHAVPDPQNWALDVERWAFPHYVRSEMSIFPLQKSSRNLIISASISLALVAATLLLADSPAEQRVLDAIKSPDLSVVHLWAPWCSNCQAELKSGGWLKMVKDNPQVKFYFVSVWNNGEDGRAMLQKFQIADQPNIVILADPGPRKGDNKIKQFAGIPLSWIPATWIYKGGDLRYALNYGEVRFPVLQQFLEDSKSEWSHKGEPSAGSQ